MDQLERLVMAGGGGKLFKPRLRDKRHLDVGPRGKLEKRFAQPCMKTMQGSRSCLFAPNNRLLIGGVQADGQDARTTVALKNQVLIRLDRQDRQLLGSTQAEHPP